MATLKQLEEQIFAREGFRVALRALDPKAKSFAPFPFDVMAPQRWKISDWKMQRLESYLTVLRRAAVLRPDGSEVKRDLQLGKLRDSYYEAQYGPIAPPPEAPDNVIRIAERRAQAKPASARKKRP